MITWHYKYYTLLECWYSYIYSMRIEPRLATGVRSSPPFSTRSPSLKSVHSFSYSTFTVFSVCSAACSLGLGSYFSRARALISAPIEISKSNRVWFWRGATIRREHTRARAKANGHSLVGTRFYYSKHCIRIQATMYSSIYLHFTNSYCTLLFPITV